MTSRHIGILAHTIGFGGMEIQTLGLSAELAARGHRVTLVELGHTFYSESGRVVPDPGVSIRTVPLPGEPESLSLNNWRRLLATDPFDGVVLPKGWFTSFWPALDWAILSRRLPYVTVEHSEPPVPERFPRRGLVRGLGLWRIPHLARWRLHRLAVDRVIAVSRECARLLVEHHGYPAARVSALPNGVDPAQFHPDQQVRAAARARWSVGDDDFVFGYLGRLVHVKRVDRILAAFAALGAGTAGRTFRLIIVGRGPAEPGLRAQAEALGVGDRCAWVGESKTPWLDYPGFDASLLASEHEGLPLALLEAMASGCVSVAMTTGGVAEVLQDGVNGRVTPQSTDAFTSAMREVASSGPERRAGIAGRAREFVLRHHDSRVQLPQAAAIIEASVDGREVA